MRKATDPEIITAVREAYLEDDVDEVTGAVHPSTVAERVDLSTSNAYRRCRRIADKGLLETVSGFDMEVSRTRIGYVALEHAPSDMRNLEI